MSSNDSTGNRRILIVDDNPAIHDDYKKILAAAPTDSELDELGAALFGDEPSVAASDAPSFELTSAFQGQEALQLVTEAAEAGEPFATAFVDMRMPPGWNGLETIEHLWEVDPNLQVVICTAFSDYSWSEIIQRVVNRDRLVILKKPFDNIEVCQLAIALTSKWNLERLAEAEMNSVVETAVDGIVTIREDGGIESCNAAACGLFDKPLAELQNATFESLLSHAGRETWEECLAGAAKGVALAREVEIQLPDGGTAPLQVSLSKFEAPEGKRYTAILRDLSEYKRLQTQLAQSQKLESIGQLAAGVAHEINTPLQFSFQNLQFLQTCAESIQAVVRTLEDNLRTDGPAKNWQARWDDCREVMESNRFEFVLTELPTAITESLDGLERVSQIVKAMKDLTHPGQADQVMTTCDLNQLAEQALTLTRNQLKSVATLQTDFAADGVELECAGQDISRVIVNLVVNAIDAIREKHGEQDDPQGRLTLSTKRAGDHVVLVVEDNGVGIDPSAKDRVFDPFFTTKDVGKGTGQGLSISYDIIASKHGGELNFVDAPAGGTVFTVRLPVKAQVDATDPSATVGGLVATATATDQ